MDRTRMIAKIYKRFLQRICLLVPMLLISCDAPVTDADIPGTYEAKYPYGIETLTVNKDGSYEQKISISGKTDVVNRGKWEFKSNERILKIHDPVIVDDGFGEPTDMKKVSGYWPLRITGSAGNVGMSINEDKGFAFKKVK